ncbi:MAG: MFS transporter [Proteobacteria bacterium]|nr:MFS transporter [Pseudomonadota bacterium]
MQDNRKALAVLFISLFLVMVGFGIIMPILPFYVRYYQGNAATLGFLMSTYSVMQFMFAPFWGRLSDRIGRRPVLLIGLSGYGASFIVFGFANHLWMLFAARIIAGIVSSATLPTAMAYVADITASEKLAKGMGLMGAAMSLGIILGPGLGGALGHYGLSLPFFAAGALALLTLPFAYYFLPESRVHSGPPAEKASWKTYLSILSHRQFPLFAIALAASFSMSMFESTFALFSADRLKFGPRDLGLMFTALGILSVAIQAGLVGKAVQRFGDAAVILVSLLVSALGLICMVQVTSVPLLWLYTGVFSAGNSFLRPSLSTLISKTSGTEQGGSMGLMQSFDSLGRIVGPVIGGLIYELHMDYTFALGAGLLFATTLMVRPRLRQYAHSSAAESSAGH